MDRRTTTETHLTNKSKNISSNMPVYRPRRGTSLASVLSFVRDKIPYKRGSNEIIRLPGNIDVWRRQSPWNSIPQLPKTANKFVHQMINGVKQGKAPTYEELAAAFKEDTRGGKWRAKRLAKQVQRVMKGQVPRGADREFVGFLGVLMVVQEGHRDPGRSPLITSAMAMQTMARTGDVDQSLGLFPPDVTGSQRGMYRLSDYIDRVHTGQARLGPDGEPVGPAGEAAELRQLQRRARGLQGRIADERRDPQSQFDPADLPAYGRNAKQLEDESRKRAGQMSIAQTVMDQEIRIIQAWASALDLKTTSENEEEKVQELFRIIRQRMHHAYGVPTSEIP